MAATTEVVKAVARTGRFNKNAARRVRVAGKLPGVVYGAKLDSVALLLDPKQMLRILHSESGHNTIFDLEIEGVATAAKAKAMIVDWQFEPIKDRLIHVDLKRIALDKAMHAEVPITLIGVAYGVKNEDGVLDQSLREVEIECLPGDIPDAIEVDVTEMKLGDVIRVSDLPHGGKFKFITDETQAVASVSLVKEDLPEVETLEAVAEPEVAKKGKGETAEAEKGDKKSEKK
jgi:large subunit ribosomal protein L25